MSKAIGLMTFILVALACDAAAAKCHVPLIRTLNNQTVTGYMWADSGRTCHIRLQSSSGPTHAAQIIQPASNGTVHVAGNSIVYRSRANFVGRDNFTYARRGMDRQNNAVVRTVQVVVEVK